MIRATMVTGMAVTAACAAFGQSAGATLHFEAASIKPAEPGNLMVRLREYPERLDYSSASLKALIGRACQVQNFRISGPDWMSSTRFDVVAKLPPDTPRSKVPEMLRSLLAERFKMAARRETKELPMYALVVGKNGPKMEESEVDPNTPPPDGGRGLGGPAATGRAAATGGAGAADCGPRGETAARAGWMINGRGHVEGHAMNMANLVDLLGGLLGILVVDQTGLKGNYDFDLDYTPDEGQPMSPGGAPAPPPPPGGGASGGEDIRIPSASTPDDGGVSLRNAVQSQLGLKLEAKKGPVEVIIVDRIERTPTEN
jgi:uncharacterized protein (TIGR03435 family)